MFKSILGSTTKQIKVVKRESGEKFIENLEGQRNNAGATEAGYLELKDVLYTLEGSLQRIAIAFGDPLLDQFRENRLAVGALIDAFAAGARSGAFDALFDVINNAMEGVEDDISQIASALPEALESIDWSGFESAAGELTEAFGGLFAGMTSIISTMRQPGNMSACVVKSFRKCVGLPFG
jgi:hypothetical protein